MAIRSGQIIGYTYELWYDGTLIHEDDEVFDTEDDANEDAQFYIEQRIEEWEVEDAWHPETGEDSEDLFDVVINDVYEKEEW